MNKKAGMLMKYLLGFMLVSLVVITFYIIPAKTSDGVTGQAGFWSHYQYIPPFNTLEENLSRWEEIDQYVTDAERELLKKEKQSLYEQFIGFISGMVKGAFGGMTTVYQTMGVSKGILQSVSIYLKVPVEITQLAIATLVMVIVITLILIVFNRSDIQ